jgi:hypothetical protein
MVPPFSNQRFWGFPETLAAQNMEASRILRVVDGCDPFTASGHLILKSSQLIQKKTFSTRADRAEPSAGLGITVNVHILVAT